MEILQQITSSAAGVIAAVVVFGLCIFFHEAGHFLAAKAAKMRVDAFALGFGPRLFGWTRGETTYSVRVIPIGGFVAIAGMEPGETEVPNGFHARRRWIGALVIFAGVTMNVVLAILLNTLVAYTQGVPRPGAPDIVVGGVYPRTPAAASNMRAGDQVVAVDGNRLGLEIATVAPNSLAERLGLGKGDRLIQVGEEAVSSPSDLRTHLAAGAHTEQRLVIVSAKATSATNAFQNVKLPPQPSLRAAATPGPDTSAQDAKFLQTALGITFGPLGRYDFIAYTNLRPDTQLAITVNRGGQELTIPVKTYALQQKVLRVNQEGAIYQPYATIGRLGLKLQAPTDPVTFIRACQLGVVFSATAVVEIVDSLHAMITRKIVAAPGGPVQIFAMSYESAQLGWAEVASFGAFLSANLAVINLLPIPPLDGFVLLVLAFEAAIRRRIDARADYFVKFAGIVLLLGLVLILTFNDLRNWIMHGTP